MKVYSAKYNNNIVPEALKKAAKELLPFLKFIPNGWIAGGALRSRIAQETVGSDLDCYFSSISDFLEAYSLLKRNEVLEAKIKHVDNTVATFDSKIGKIDLVKNFYQTPEDCILDFDFTVCAFALDHQQNVYWSKEGIEHLENRKLVLLNPSCPLSSMIRIQKYVLKGYLMDLDNFVALGKLFENKNIDSTAQRLKAKNKPNAYPSKNIFTYPCKNITSISYPNKFNLNKSKLDSNIMEINKSKLDSNIMETVLQKALDVVFPVKKPMLEVGAGALLE